jgi:hypothetical protein
MCADPSPTKKRPGAEYRWTTNNRSQMKIYLRNDSRFRPSHVLGSNKWAERIHPPTHRLCFHEVTLFHFFAAVPPRRSVTATLVWTSRRLNRKSWSLPFLWLGLLSLALPASHTKGSAHDFLFKRTLPNKGDWLVHPPPPLVVKNSYSCGPRKRV